jgi:hypothetical protein
MSKKAKLPHAIAGLVGAQGTHSLSDAFGFIKQFRQFTKLGGTTHRIEPILFEKSESAGSAKGHYFHQDLLVAKLIHDDAPERHIDIGSRIDGFVAHVAAFRKIEILDVRPLNSTGHPNIEFRIADLMHLDPDLINACDSLSCLHAIEHFGLGRYGDELNPQGHIAGFQNMVKMLKPGGKLYISFPIATQSAIVFNKHRIFSPYDIFAWPTLDCTLNLLRFDYVDDAGDIHQNVDLNTENIIAKYACGIYTFEKLIGDIDCNPNAILAEEPKPQLTFLMEPSNQEGAGSFYQRPFLASLMAQSLGTPFLLAANPHSDCHYQKVDHLAIEREWGNVFHFLGPTTQFPTPLQNLTLENKLVGGQTYNAPFELSYQYLDKLDKPSFQALLNPARQRFLENIQRYPELLPQARSAAEGIDGKPETIIAIHLRDRSKGDPPFSTKTLLDWQMFSRDYGLPDNNPDYYSRLYAHAVNQIVENNHIENPVLHIHSTGEEKSFQKMLALLNRKISVKLFLNTSPPKSFVDLVLADYLIASHSSFSWLASLLRTGPTFMRGKFRHFVTAETQFIEEVLYQNTNWLQKIWIRLNIKLGYQILGWR